MVRKSILALDSAVHKTSRFFGVVAGLLTVMMIFTTTYGVVMRYFFRRPEPISSELSTIFMLWAFVFAISLVELRKEQIRADIFSVFLPRGLVRFLNRIVSPILGFLYCSILTYKGYGSALYSYQIGERSMQAWAEPIFPIKAMIPIGYFLLTVVILRHLIHGVAMYVNEDTSDEDPNAATLG